MTLYLTTNNRTEALREVQRQQFFGNDAVIRWNGERFSVVSKPSGTYGWLGKKNNDQQNSDQLEFSANLTNEMIRNLPLPVVDGVNGQLLIDTARHCFIRYPLGDDPEMPEELATRLYNKAVLIFKCEDEESIKRCMRGEAMRCGYVLPLDREDDWSPMADYIDPIEVTADIDDNTFDIDNNPKLGRVLRRGVR